MRSPREESPPAGGLSQALSANLANDAPTPTAASVAASFAPLPTVNPATGCRLVSGRSKPEVRKGQNGSGQMGSAFVYPGLSNRHTSEGWPDRQYRVAGATASVRSGRLLRSPVDAPVTRRERHG
jgi:hypothetical protein